MFGDAMVFCTLWSARSGDCALQSGSSAPQAAAAWHGQAQPPSEPEQTGRRRPRAVVDGAVGPGLRALGPGEQQGAMR
jgi:hypothetical protein